MLDYQFSPGALKLAGELQVQYLDILSEALEPALAEPGPLSLDLSEVREVDVAGLQMLLAFLRGRPEPTNLTHLPRVMRRALELSGLSEQFAPMLD